VPEKNKTPEQEKYTREVYRDVLNIRLTNTAYRLVYKVAKENKTTMSEVGRLCVETGLMDVDRLLKEIRKIKDEQMQI
jgi:hypothetical protein